ncbi:MULTISPECIES: N-acetylglutaminylglutamine amidotransferase [unclassified Modestobacter]|uniref:N-acetylglutaminylglutamine amidotransferase n=1 Tax=unclassified Modestobacter TaxID=2643866 RepID=UPI0022AAF726|nr:MULTISPECIES: N-acetylglutaminylglutamine amidotransferase [unclassified Modestobacter]MCZ2825256.1 N-acetylglutaminylglutamine amidotransferase [Modestobacter sp. VKM Ac-2981]MCZ2853679.1 N-acetylglutaminylglutamine amidotransferase [Modestobacter sp. VKM Ac-2982]
MCGISGEVRFDGDVADMAAVSAMCDQLQRRGPDGSGGWQAGPVALGHRRLKIIDLTDAGAQPMVDAELGLTMVFNGIIYNYKELRAELQGAGYRFFSTSDTEVVLKAYHRWGAACVERFLGMFAFAVVERDSGRVVLARDRFGIKPLYLSRGPGRVRFASSLPALVRAGGVDTSIDPVALHHYMSFHAVVPAPRTILAGVGKLPPATVRTYEADGRESDWEYWRPVHERRAEFAGLDAVEWQERVLEQLRVAVRRRMVADVPVGVLLSGGIDSSLVVGLLAEEGQKGLATFSIGFEAVGERSGDEFAYSDVVAETFGTDHHRLMVPSADVHAGLDGAVAAMSEPQVSHDAVAFYLLSQQVSQHVKVVQSGQGADEVLAGYDWYPPLEGVPAEEAVDAYARVFVDRSHAELATQLSDRWVVTDDVSRALIAEHFARPGAETTLDKALRLDSTIMLVDDPVKRVDNMTMAWGLEARVPFLDHEFVELAAAVPPELKLAHGGKGVLKDAARAVIPADVIDRPKGYFPVPAITDLHGDYLETVRAALRAPEARERGLFRTDYVERLLADPNGHRTTLGANQLWQVGLLELWLQRHGIR